MKNKMTVMEAGQLADECEKLFQRAALAWEKYMKTTYKLSGVELVESKRKGKRTVYTTRYKGKSLVSGFNRKQVIESSYPLWLREVAI